MKLNEEQHHHLQMLIARYDKRFAKAEAKGRDPYGDGSSLSEARKQFVSMAAGGTGGPTGQADNSTIREIYYPNYPDYFFQVMCGRYGWQYRDR